jgi:phospholipid/cholesterol/gamma-HCH transport system substrate-binding protein
MKREAKIGLFVLIAGAKMIFFIRKTCVVVNLFSPGSSRDRKVRLELDDASGLRADAAVRVAGVKVGKVAEVQLEGTIAVAILQIPEDMVFREGAQASLENQGVLGDRFVSIFPGIGEPLPDQSRLEAGAPPTLDDITSNVNKLAENLIEISENVKQGTLTETGDNRLAQIAENFEILTETLVKMLEDNRGNVNDTTNEIAALAATLNRELPQLVEEMTALTSDLRNVVGGNRANVDETMENVAKVSDNLERMAESLVSITEKIDRGEGTIGRLLTDDSTIEKFNSILDTANESIEEVKGIVDEVVDTKIDLTFRTEYLTKHEAFRSHFGVIIQPDENKYYQLEGVARETDFLLPEISTEIEEVFDADGNLVNTIVRTEETEPDDLVFNAVLAYRFSEQVFLKGGVFESAAGGGLDVFLPRHSLRFSVEAFDFGRDEYGPHGKLFFQYRLGKTVQFHVGWDEFLESELSSAMVGGGIRWKDEDIKLLLSTGRFFR